MQLILDSLARLIELGGPVVIVLLLLSVAGVAIVVFKVFELASFRRRSFEEADRALTDGARDPRSVLARLAVTARHERDTGVPQERLEAEYSRRGNALLRDLMRWLRPLEIIAYVAPLLGLLGTVLGMIEAFRGLEASGADGGAGALAGGIWEALLTTALGLGIAIPLTAAHSFLEGRIGTITEQLRDLLDRALQNPCP